MLVALAKGGEGREADTTDPNNYRRIALLKAISKLFSNVLEMRLTKYLWQTKQIAAEQFGFSKGRRTQCTLDLYFILDSRYIDIYDAKKRMKPLYQFVCTFYRFLESV